MLNQEIMVLGSTNLVGSTEEGGNQNHESVNQKQLKQKFLTENLQDSQQQKDRRQNISKNQDSSEISSTKYVHGFQSNENKLSS